MNANNGVAFQAFQQIALLNILSLRHLVAIEFIRDNPEIPKILKYMKKYYPNIKVNFRNI